MNRDGTYPAVNELLWHRLLGLRLFAVVHYCHMLNDLGRLRSSSLIPSLLQILGIDCHRVCKAHMLLGLLWVEAKSAALVNLVILR